MFHYDITVHTLFQLFYMNFFMPKQFRMENLPTFFQLRRYLIFNLMPLIH